MADIFPAVRAAETLYPQVLQTAAETLYFEVSAAEAGCSISYSFPVQTEAKLSELQEGRPDTVTMILLGNAAGCLTCFLAQDALKAFHLVVFSRKSMSPATLFCFCRAACTSCSMSSSHLPSSSPGLRRPATGGTSCLHRQRGPAK